MYSQQDVALQVDQLDRNPKMKRTVAISLLTLVCHNHALSDVVFDFHYAGPIGSGIGFEDAALGQIRRDALQSAANSFGQLFEHDAIIDIQVRSIDNPSTDTLASAVSALNNPTTAGFGQIEVVRTKILTGTDKNGTAADAHLEVNWAKNWSTSGNASGVGHSQFDFYSTVYHELSHAVGIFGSIDAAGRDVFGTLPNSPGKWSTFASWITGPEQVPLIDPATAQLDKAQWSKGSVNGLFFSGPNAVAAFDGLPVPLHTPFPFEAGSSVHHLANTDPSLSGLLLLSEASLGPGPRELSILERGIFTDLGYSLAVQSVGVEGDYNSNGAVDAADYTLWRNSLGKTVLAGTGSDGNHNGTIDRGDILVWKQHFGEPGTSGQARMIGVVPEPSALSLLVIACAPLLVRRRSPFSNQFLAPGSARDFVNTPTGGKSWARSDESSGTAHQAIL